jgi:hypothetical protein
MLAAKIPGRIINIASIASHTVLPGPLRLLRLQGGGGRC